MDGLSVVLGALIGALVAGAGHLVLDRRWRQALALVDATQAAQTAEISRLRDQVALLGRLVGEPTPADAVTLVWLDAARQQRADRLAAKER